MAGCSVQGTQWRVPGWLMYTDKTGWWPSVSLCSWWILRISSALIVQFLGGSYSGDMGKVALSGSFSGGRGGWGKFMRNQGSSSASLAVGLLAGLFSHRERTQFTASLDTPFQSCSRNLTFPSLFLASVSVTSTQANGARPESLLRTYSI